MASGDPNYYAYVLNNPIVLTDPKGEFGNIVIGAVIGGTIGIVRAGFAGENLTAGLVRGAIVGGVAGATLALPVLTAAGGIGLAAFNVSIWEQNFTNALTGRKSKAHETIGVASAQGITTFATAALGGGLGRLAGDIGADVSSAFGTNVGRLFSASISAMWAIGQGAVQGVSK